MEVKGSGGEVWVGCLSIASITTQGGTVGCCLVQVYGMLQVGSAGLC